MKNKLNILFLAVLISVFISSRPALETFSAEGSAPGPAGEPVSTTGADAELERQADELLERIDKDLGQQKTEGPLNISGTWLEMKEGRPIGEWKIKVDDEGGKIVLTQPSQHAPGKVIEYSGSMEGDVITARHVIKDPDLVDPRIHRKVKETVIKEYTPTWDLELKVSREGTVIKGKRIGFKITYDRETLELKEVKLRFERELVLQKKQEE